MIKLRQECGWLTFAVTQLSYILRMKVVSEFDIRQIYSSLINLEINLI